MRKRFLAIVFSLLCAGVLAQTASDWMQKGMDDYRNARYDEALVKLKKATEPAVDPQTKASAFLVCGLIHQILGDEEQAKLAFSNAIIANPNLSLDRDTYSPRTVELFVQAKQEGFQRLERGKELYTEAKYDEALQDLNVGINLLLATSPQIDRSLIVDGYFTAAQIYQVLNKQDAAVREFEKALLVDPERQLDPDYYSPATIALFNKARSAGNQIVDQARQLITQQNYDSAIEVLEKNQDRYSARATRLNASVLLAQAYYSKRNESRAGELVKTVLQIEPEYKPKTGNGFEAFFEETKLKLRGGIPKVLVVQAKANKAHELAIQGFQQELKAEYRQTTPDKVQKAMSEFAPDSVFVVGADALKPIEKYRLKAPVVFANVLRSDLQSLDWPNVGGVYLELPLEAQFSYLRSLLPSAKSVGILYNKETRQEFINQASRVAKDYGLEIVARSIESTEEIDDDFRRLGDIDVYWLNWDKATFVSEDVLEILIREASRRKIPVLAIHESFVRDKGALLSVSSSFSEMGKQAAELTRKVLQVENLQVLPKVFPAYSKPAVNLSVAKRLEVAINPNAITSSTLVYR